MTTESGDACHDCSEPLANFESVVIAEDGTEYCPKCAEMHSVAEEDMESPDAGRL